MTDRLKVSLFDTLSPYGIEGTRVLDLYAGSGALGIEMLSRGAVWADFVEQNPAMCRLIADNLKSTGLGDGAHVYRMWVARFLAMKSRALGGVAEPEGEGGGENGQNGEGGGSAEDRRSMEPVDGGAEYDIILLDPPYADPAIEATLETIALSPILAPDGLVVLGHINRRKMADEYGGGRIKRARHRAMGDSAFSIYERV